MSRKINPFGVERVKAYYLGDNTKPKRIKIQHKNNVFNFDVKKGDYVNVPVQLIDDEIFSLKRPAKKKAKKVSDATTTDILDA